MPMLGVHKEIKVQRPIASDELNIFYNSAGEAVWQIQYLEHAIVSFVVIKRHKKKALWALSMGELRMRESKKCLRKSDLIS